MLIEPAYINCNKKCNTIEKLLNKTNGLHSENAIICFFI